MAASAEVPAANSEPKAPSFAPPVIDEPKASPVMSPVTDEPDEPGASSSVSPVLSSANDEPGASPFAPPTALPATAPETPLVTDEPTKPLTTPPLPTLALLIILALGALAASAGLVLSEIQHLKEPTSALGCDLNPLVGCSSSLLSWQAHLFLGVPNSLVGVAFFAGLTGVFLTWIRGNPPRWLLLLIEAGLTLSLGLIAFFLFESVTVFRALCPFCLVVWVTTILLWVQLGALLVRLGVLGHPTSAFWRFWVAQRWFISAIVLLLIVLVVAITLFDKLTLSF